MIMRQFERPYLISSKCIGFEPCRYNGLMITSSIVEKLREYAEFIPVCPEVGIGLGVPRDPVRVVDTGNGLELFQPATGKKFAQKMKLFSDSFLNSVKTVDGFILKNKSPSCGVKAINVYTSFQDSRPRKDGVGLFAKNVIKKFSNIPVEDEGRLRNLFIRENFLTKIFTIADFRKVRSGNFQDILNFHTKNKLLLMSYSKENTNEMGRKISDHHEESLKDLKVQYESLLFETLSEIPKISSNINVLMHALGYFSKELTHDEKAFFLNSLQEYREGRIPLLVCLNIIKLWIIRFEQDYLLNQTFFEPYPQDLMQITFI
jgi:uncharacterized protein YbgA (DUF1722 family)/uncharacterized protein YbbK (DUF523 family)